MILIGTSGYSYTDWKGPFYPRGLQPKDYLEFYAEEFKTCELNFTYYKMPTATQLQRMAERTNGRLVFTVKAHQSITHEAQPDPGALDDFLRATRGLKEIGCLGALLFQFPYSFHNNEQNRLYLRQTLATAGDYVPVVEFRNRRWISEQTFEMLREVDAGFCCVDEPRLRGLIPPHAVATSRRVAYVRFHGRNAASWWNPPTPSERYNYLYTTDELREWVPKIHNLSRQSETTFVFTNNHFCGKAVINARQLLQLLS